MSASRAVVVTRPTELEHLVARHGTREQARFALKVRGQDLGEVEDRHEKFQAVLTAVSQAIPTRWRRSRIARDDLPRFVWEPEDVVVVVGQDGLVANVAKYLSTQRVVGVNPEPSRIEGILVRHKVEALASLVPKAGEGKVTVEERTLVSAELDDGQRLRALNEIYIGHRTHQSSRYRIRRGTTEERQSSSGVIVATGTGATGWAKSISRDRKHGVELPAPTDPRLAFFVREAWPSKATGVEITEGVIGGGDALEIVSELEDGGVLFGDGIEDDRLRVGWGIRVKIRASADRLRLVVGA